VNETVFQYWNNVKQYWDKFSRAQKITFLATVILFILTVGIISYNLSKTDYALAFTNLQPSDAASITEYLTSAKIPYELSPDGKSIGVPRKQVAEVKIAVESQGLNKTGNLGYGEFKQSSFGMTDNVFKVKQLEAIQGELQQLINMNNAISGSKVLINLPDESVFLRNDSQEKASASVALQLKQGYVLDQAKIDTIYNLVSHSLPNLPVENITISDQNGDPLVYSKLAPGQMSSTNIAAQQFKINNEFRSDIQKNVTSMLGRILGPDKVIVSVVSTMNFDQRKSHQALVTPVDTINQRGIEISLQQLSKSYSSEGGASGGVAGTGITDIPTYQGTTGSGKTDSEENQTTTNFEVNRITNDIDSAPYVVKDLTINVGIEPPVKEDPNSLTQETKDQVQQILVNVVRAALADSGQPLTDEDLNKKVTVFSHSFASTATGIPTNQNAYWLYSLLGALAMALIIGPWVIIARRKKAARLAAEAEAAEAANKVELPTIDMENVTSDNQVRKQLESLAKKKPEEFVNLLRTWLVDEG
jgi:flagellar M-ring protein FliF